MFCEDSDGRNLREINLYGPIELQLIKEGGRSRRCWVAVPECEVSERRPDRLRADPAMRCGWIAIFAAPGGR